MECETARRIHTMFEHWVARTPDAEAAVDADTRLSYRALDDRANRLAQHLRAAGVGPGARVGICMDRGVGMIEAIFAIFKAGGAYVPMDPAYPAQRLREMTEDARPAALVADAMGQRALAAAFVDAVAPPTIAIAAVAARAMPDAVDPIDADAASATTAEAFASLDENDDPVAYVIYTSGSTGRPKGVEVTHAAALHLWRALDAVLSLSGDSSADPSVETPNAIAPHRAAMNASLSFDVSVQGWSRLLSGDCVVVPSRTAKLDPEQMLALLEREAVDLFDCTPAQLVGLIDAGLLNRPALAGMTVVVAGEAIPPALWTRLQASDGPRFFNAYGPTEATVYATATAIRDAGPTPHIGTPLPNVRIEILDETRSPVAPGAVGEVYIGGAGVARGYLHRPELTAERFVADPRRPGERLYRTGDLGRSRDDGAIDYLGRNDFQVKIRGFRVELGEIEAAIAQTPGVRDAVALVRDDANGPRLIAYFRSEAMASSAATPATIREALASRLPDYMLPAAYVRVDAWPQTVNGKLDRAALPAPGADDVAADAFAAPRTVTERALAAMWAELLGRDAVGRDDGFLRLGGDSLRLIQLASRIRAECAVDLPVQALFAARSLAEMAETIDREAAAQREDGGGFDGWTSPDPLPMRVPLSYQQSGLWLLERLASTSIAYNAQNVIRIRGALDPERLERAVARLAQRHEILRTSFHDDREADRGDDRLGEPYQVVHAGAPGMFVYRALETPPDEAALRALIETEVAHVFDLARLPLLRFALFALAPEDFLLIQVEQHYVHDGWSMNLILRELLALYDADADDALPPPAAQYRDYALWQRSEPAKARFAAQVAYWKRKLEGVSLELPMRTDFPRPAVPCYVGDQVRVVLPPDLSRALRAFCRDEGVTLFAAMQAAYRMTVAYFAGSDDFLIGSAVGNRVWRDSESMAGMFVNMIPTRCDLSGDPTYRALIARTTADLAEGYANQEAPFEWVVREIHPQREFSRNPLFQTAFSTHNSPGPQLDWPQFSLKIHEVYGNRTSKFDFDAVMIPRATDDPDGITLFWEYCVALYRRDTIERLNDAYLRVLAQCVARPSLRLSDVEFLAPEERARLLEGRDRAPEAAAAAPSFLHAGFEAHAARSPDAPAVEEGERIATYGELDARANRLARHLRALGAGPDRPIALCMTRSIAAVEAVLAVAKAGAAYLPLDPMLPEARLSFVLDDARPPILLTDRAHRALAERAVAAQSVAGHGVSGPSGELATRAHVVDVDADAAAWASYAADAIDPAEIGLAPHHLAYAIYTSGSTGTPKGVLVEHRQIMAIAAGWARQYDLAPGARHLQMANLAFDVFTADLLRALGHGGTLVLCPQETLADPAALEARLRASRIDIADFVPVVLDALVAHLEAHGRDLNFMRTIVCGSDRWSADAADRARRVVGDGVRLLHAYGLTETSVDSTCFEIAPRGVASHESTPHESAPPLAVLPIGDAVANARVLVLDRERRPVPVGVIGELYIGGAGVARGYLARPELQAERFLDSPFHPGERLYRTGDLGRRLPEGGIEFVGRNDAQVKIRGHRVELGEIEARLRAQPGVEDAAVVLRTDAPTRDGEPAEAALVAYVMPSGRDAAVDVDALHRALRAKLPAHMVPAAYVAIDAWPRTANGKLDRAALPPPSAGCFAATEEPIAPRTPIEEAVAEVWCDVLGRDAIGVRDDFFRLGGNSLSAMRVLVALRDLFGVGLPLRRLFEAPTVESLVEAMLDASMAEARLSEERAPDLSAEDAETVA